jgi:hypothetical protein
MAFSRRLVRVSVGIEEPRVRPQARRAISDPG